MNPQIGSNSVVNHTEWLCPRCDEFSPARFQVCWNCGSERDGTLDPRFETVRDVGEIDPPDSLWTPAQWSVRELFVVTTFLCVCLAAAMAFGPDAALMIIVVVFAVIPFTGRLASRT